MRGDVPWGGHGRHGAVVAPKRLSGVFPSQGKCAGRAGMLKLGVWEGSGLGRRMLPESFP